MLQKINKKDDTEFCGVILYEILSNVFRDAYKKCHESKDLREVTDSSKYLKSMLVQGMADENAVNESWGCISQE